MQSSSHFWWPTPFLMDQQLTDEEGVFRNGHAAILATAPLPRRTISPILSGRDDSEVFQEMVTAGPPGAAKSEEYGVIDDHVMRHARNLKRVNLDEETYDIHTLISGPARTSLQAFC